MLGFFDILAILSGIQPGKGKCCSGEKNFLKFFARSDTITLILADKGGEIVTFYEKMRLVCLAIPAGRVATYGQIAMLCGKPGNSRQVGYGLREGLAGEDIPAFRVVNSRGELSGARHFLTSDLQQALLADDGVPVLWNGRCWYVNLKQYGWKTTPEDFPHFADFKASPDAEEI